MDHGNPDRNGEAFNEMELEVLLESYDEEKDIITRKGNAKASATRRTKANREKADSRQTGSGPQIVLTPVEELLININSGRPGMEGVPGGTYVLRESGAIPHWLNVGFCVFLHFRFFCLRSNTCKPCACHSAYYSKSLFFW